MKTTTLELLRRVITGIIVLLLLFAVFGARTQMAHDYGPHYLAFVVLVVVVDVLLARAAIKRRELGANTLTPER